MSADPLLALVRVLASADGEAIVDGPDDKARLVDLVRAELAKASAGDVPWPAVQAGCAMADCALPATHVEHDALIGNGADGDTERVTILTCADHADTDAVPMDPVYFASLPAAPLTVGAALATPQAKAGTHVVEFHNDSFYEQLRIDGYRLLERDDGEEAEDPGAYWPRWRPTVSNIEMRTIPRPARLVLLADADADPSTRGPL